MGTATPGCPLPRHSCHHCCHGASLDSVGPIHAVPIPGFAQGHMCLTQVPRWQKLVLSTSCGAADFCQWEHRAHSPCPSAAQHSLGLRIRPGYGIGHLLLESTTGPGPQPQAEAAALGPGMLGAGAAVAPLRGDLQGPSQPQPVDPGGHGTKPKPVPQHPSLTSAPALHPQGLQSSSLLATKRLPEVALAGRHRRVWMPLCSWPPFPAPRLADLSLSVSVCAAPVCS